MADHICPLCGKIFAQLRPMKRHVRVEHEGKRHECSICHKQFTRLYNLTKHKKLHSKVVCKYNFNLLYCQLTIDHSTFNSCIDVLGHNY